LTASIPNFRNRQEWNSEKARDFLRSFFTALFWIGIMALFYFVLFRKMGGGAGGPGGQIFSIGKSRAKFLMKKIKSR
jgi:ATP-dependent Zn protease